MLALPWPACRPPPGRPRPPRRGHRCGLPPERRPPARPQPFPKEMARRDCSWPCHLPIPRPSQPMDQGYRGQWRQLTLPSGVCRPPSADMESIDTPHRGPSTVEAVPPTNWGARGHDPRCSGPRRGRSGDGVASTQRVVGGQRGDPAIGTGRDRGSRIPAQFARPQLVARSEQFRLRGASDVTGPRWALGCAASSTRSRSRGSTRCCSRCPTRTRAVTDSVASPRGEEPRGRWSSTSGRRRPRTPCCDAPAPGASSSVGGGGMAGGMGGRAQGTRVATEHLLGLGHRRIAYLGEPGTSGGSTRRLRGFNSAVTAAGLVAERRSLLRDEAAAAGGILDAGTASLRGGGRIRLAGHVGARRGSAPWHACSRGPVGGRIRRIGSGPPRRSHHRRPAVGRERSLGGGEPLGADRRLGGRASSPAAARI